MSNIDMIIAFGSFGSGNIPRISERERFGFEWKKIYKIGKYLGAGTPVVTIVGIISYYLYKH